MISQKFDAINIIIPTKSSLWIKSPAFFSTCKITLFYYTVSILIKQLKQKRYAPEIPHLYCHFIYCRFELKRFAKVCHIKCEITWTLWTCRNYEEYKKICIFIAFLCSCGTLMHIDDTVSEIHCFVKSISTFKKPFLLFWPFGRFMQNVDQFDNLSSCSRFVSLYNLHSLLSSHALRWFVIVPSKRANTPKIKQQEIIHIPNRIPLPFTTNLLRNNVTDSSRSWQKPFPVPCLQ